MPAESLSHLTLSTIEASGVAGLGVEGLHATFEEHKTILVGKNGAGKSAVMTGVYNALRGVLNARRGGQGVGSVRCVLNHRGRPRFEYERNSVPSLTPDEDDERQLARFSERCFDVQTRDELWSLADGSLRVGSDVVSVPSGVSLLALDDANQNPQSLAIRELFRGTVVVPAGIPRSLPTRQPQFVERTQTGTWIATGQTRSRLGSLAARLANMRQNADKHHIEEVSELLRRVGVESDIGFHPFDPSRGETVYGIVTLGGDELGELSDGTLRVLETLVALTSTTGRLLLIEEPETGIHPGLLDRLLSVVEAYSQDRQIVISTHSPYVVSWCEPIELRLVERVGSTSTVVPLAPNDVEQVEGYLNDEGTLGEYIFDTDES